jgi:hypothetical protein
MATNTRRPPSLDLVSFTSPLAPSDSQLDEKNISSQSSTGNRWHYSLPPPYISPDTARPFPPLSSQFFRAPAPIPIRSISHQPCSFTSQLRILKPWLPLILYAITSLGFIVAFAFYRTEVFACESPFQTYIIIEN